MSDPQHECEVCLRPATYRTVRFPWRYLCDSHAETLRYARANDGPGWSTETDTVTPL